jgi:hypothetical protein
MDAIVKNEQAKVNAVDTWGELEYQLAGEIAAWILTQPLKFPSMQIATNAYWNERLN